MFCDFHTTTHAKWILAGEHAVLRGHSALVFPIHHLKLTLQYHAAHSDLKINYAGEEAANLQQLFQNVLEHGFKLLNRSTDDLTGHFNIHNNIPIGAGMGASAALSVAVARWFAAQHMLIHMDIQHFARELEHLFHGKSSGLDIAGVAATSGIYFQQGNAVSIKQAWQPKWCLSHSGKTGITAHCIQTVETLWQANVNLGKEIDQAMHDSVTQARTVLEDENGSLQQLANAIHQAADCFKRWGLLNEPLRQHMHALEAAGAVATKPTGSGGGGYVLSLWEHPPSIDGLIML